MRGKIQPNVKLRQQVLDKLKDFPIATSEFVPVVLEASRLMLEDTYLGKPMKDIISKAANKGAFIGQLFPIAFNEVLARSFAHLFRPEQEQFDKDVVCVSNDRFSFEIKVSTDKEKIVGNLSYASDGGYKDKHSFYLAVNFDKNTFEVILIRFGWLDIEDWSISSSYNGQGSTVKTLPMRSKMITVYERKINNEISAAS